MLAYRLINIEVNRLFLNFNTYFRRAVVVVYFFLAKKSNQRRIATVVNMSHIYMYTHWIYSQVSESFMRPYSKAYSSVFFVHFCASFALDAKRKKKCFSDKMNEIMMWWKNSKKNTPSIGTSWLSGITSLLIRGSYSHIWEWNRKLNENIQSTVSSPKTVWGECVASTLCNVTICVK